MKIISIILFYREPGKNPEDTPLNELAMAHELSSFGFFQRGSVKEWTVFFSKTLAQNTRPGVRQTVEHEEYACHVNTRFDNCCGVCICDKEYPARVAFSIITKVADEFKAKYSAKWSTEPMAMMPYPELNTYLLQYQDPKKSDNLMRLQKELDETKIILHKTIETVLERGQKLDSLVEKSSDLSRQSKMFYKTSKKTNSTLFRCYDYE